MAKGESESTVRTKEINDNAWWNLFIAGRVVDYNYFSLYPAQLNFIDFLQVSEV